MISSFKDQRTAALSQGIAVKGTPNDVAKIAKRKLRMIKDAVVLNDLLVPPGNHLEALKDDLKGFHSIRVNDKWRIVFRWVESGAQEVWFTDYH